MAAHEGQYGVKAHVSGAAGEPQWLLCVARSPVSRRAQANELLLGQIREAFS